MLKNKDTIRTSVVDCYLALSVLNSKDERYKEKAYGNGIDALIEIVNVIGGEKEVEQFIEMMAEHPSEKITEEIDNAE